jgi:DnaK suppressor protein
MSGGTCGASQPSGAATARILLAEERAGTQARLAALERDFDAIVASSAAAATDDEHDPEGGSTAFERQHIAALIAAAQDQLAGIGEALGRLDEGSYGVCERCGRAIAADRLAARPTATACMDCAVAGQTGRPGGGGRADRRT